MKPQTFTALPPLAVKTCFVLLLLAIPLLMALQQTLSEQQRLQQKIDVDMRQLQAHRQAAEKIRTSQKAFARNQSGSVKTTPDLLAFQLLGKARRDDVALISLEVDNSQHRVRLEVVTDSVNTLLDFTARLQQLAGKVELESHSNDKLFDAPWKVRGTLSMEFNYEG